MSENTQQFERRQRPLKTISAYLGIAAVAVSLVAGFSKSYYVTPMKLEEHDKHLRRLDDINNTTTREMREQRDILLEIRGDIKVLNRQSRNPGRTTAEN